MFNAAGFFFRWSSGCFLACFRSFLCFSALRFSILCLSRTGTRFDCFSETIRVRKKREIKYEIISSAPQLTWSDHDWGVSVRLKGGGVDGGSQREILIFGCVVCAKIQSGAPATACCHVISACVRQRSHSAGPHQAKPLGRGGPTIIESSGTVCHVSQFPALASTP